MNLRAPALIGMPDQASSPLPDQRRRYEAILAEALRYAQRILPAEQAFEIAHDVTIEMLQRPAADPPTGPVLYLAITRRRRDAWRAAERRAAREGVYLQMQSDDTPAWAEPGANLEALELRERVRDVVGRMPPAMREVFLLVREEGLSYKAAAACLGIGVSTVHTHLSRAGALLRECVKTYYADRPSARLWSKGEKP